MDQPDILLSLFLCDYLFHIILSQKSICAQCDTMGRRVRQRNRIHRHVADGKKESGKLVLVDRNEHCIDPFIFCKALRIHKCVLFDFVDHGFFWFDRMDKTYKNNCCRE